MTPGDCNQSQGQRRCGHVGLCFKGDEVLAEVEWVALFGDDVLTVQEVGNEEGSCGDLGFSRACYPSIPSCTMREGNATISSSSLRTHYPR